MPGNVRTDHVTHRQGPAADTPAAGAVVLYAKADGDLYKKDDEGNEVVFLTDISASGGNKELDEDTANAWQVAEDADVYLDFTTTTGAPSITLGDTALSGLQTQVAAGTGGLGLVSAGSALLDAVNAVEINSSAGSIDIGNDDVDQDITVGSSGGRAIELGTALTQAVVDTAAGDVTLKSDNESRWVFKPNVALSLRLDDGTDNYLLVDTTTGSEGVTFGNATTDPDFSFLGAGQATFGGAVDFDAGVTITGAGSFSQTIGGFIYNSSDDDFDIQSCSSFSIIADGEAADAIRLEATGGGGFDFDAGTGGYNVNSDGPVAFLGPDNAAQMWGVWQAANAYIVCNSSNGSERITLYQPTTVDASLSVTGAADVEGQLQTKMGVASGADIKVGGLLYSNNDSSSVVENTVVETEFDTKKAVPAGTLAPGRVISLRALCYIVSTDVGGAEIDLRVKLGDTELLVANHTSGAAGHIAVFDLTIHVLDGGGVDTNRTIATYGTVHFGAGGGNPEAVRVLSAGVDLSGALDLRITAEWAVAHADNEVLCDSFVARIE